MNPRPFLILTLITTTALTLSTPTFAAKKGWRKYDEEAERKLHPKPDNTKRNDTPADPPSTQSSSELSLAENDLLAAQKKVTDAFESSQDWKDALKAESTAQSAYGVARNNAITSLKIRPDYTNALANNAKAEKQVQELHDTPGSSAADVAAAAASAMTTRSVVSTMESNAVAQDPGATEAKKTLDSAASAMDKLHEKEKSALTADPDYQSAKTRCDNAKAKLASKTN